MTFKEAIVKMIEGRILKNDIYPIREYWFEKGFGCFLMKTIGGQFSDAIFDKKEINSDAWYEKNTVLIQRKKEDFVIKRFDQLSDTDRQEIFSILKKYKGDTKYGR